LQCEAALETYTFLTPDSQITTLNGFAASEEQNLMTFSNKPPFPLFIPRSRPRNASERQEIAGNPIQPNPSEAPNAPKLPSAKHWDQ